LWWLAVAVVEIKALALALVDYCKAVLALFLVLQLR
jgi:hypothetical protein